MRKIITTVFILTLILFALAGCDENNNEEFAALRTEIEALRAAISTAANETRITTNEETQIWQDNRKWGVIDKTGREIVPLKYDYIEQFSNGLAAVNMGGTVDRDEWSLHAYGGKWGLIKIVNSIVAEKPSSWAEEQVNSAIAEGLVPQNLQSNYTQAITRAEFAALAVALYEKVRGEIAGRIEFNDTNDINVQKAAHIGVVTGVGNNRFDPNARLTREQAAVMLSRLSDAIEKPFPKKVTTFADNNLASSWALEAIGRVQAAEIMGGVGSNRFAPQDPYTREQSIITIMRQFAYAKLFAELPLAEAYAAYYDILRAEIDKYGIWGEKEVNKIKVSIADMPFWDDVIELGAISHAKLIDLDNSGIPELVFVHTKFHCTYEWAINQVWYIFGYSEKTELYYENEINIYNTMGGGSSLGIAIDNNDNKYLINGSYGVGGGGSSYSILNNSKWDIVLTTSVGEDSYYINNELVTYEEYNNIVKSKFGELTYINITDNFLGFYDYPPNISADSSTVHAVLAELELYK